MTIEFAVRNNYTNEVVFFDSHTIAYSCAKSIGKASIFAYHNGGTKVRHSYEVRNGNARKVNKVIAGR